MALKFLSHIAARARNVDAVSERIASLVTRWRKVNADLRFDQFQRLPNDPFHPDAPYRATLEIRGCELTPDRLARLLTGFGSEIEDVAQAEASTALFGQEIEFVEPDPLCPIRLEYLMRRKENYDHASYLKRYRDEHSRFGLATPGAHGYMQFHVNLEASQSVAQAAGVGIWTIDSVSELHLHSLDEFLAGVSGSTIGIDAIADEKLFVKRTQSFYLCSQRISLHPSTAV